VNYSPINWRASCFTAGCLVDWDLYPIPPTEPTPQALLPAVPAVGFFDGSFPSPFLSFIVGIFFSLVIAPNYRIQNNYKNINGLYLSSKEERIRQLFSLKERKEEKNKNKIKKLAF
jgi:hypothetical protein